MRKFAALIALFGLTLALAGCGGDSGCGALSGGTSGSTSSSTCNGTTTPTGTPSAVAVSSTTANIPPDGSSPATITAVVTSSSGAAVSGVTVTFSASAGTLSSTTATTGSTGQATATLAASGVAVGTAITVTATVGSVSGKTTVTVANSTTSNGVATLTVTTTAATLPSDGSGSATIQVLAKDSNNNALSGVSVTLAASAGTLSGATTTTAANGTVTASLSAAGVAAGTTITVTATSGTATGKATVSVVATQQTITLLTSSPQMPSNNSKPATITAIVQGANNQLLSGVVLTFEASSGAISPVQTTAGAASSTQVPAGTTDANGEAQATLSTPGNETNRAITVTVMAGSTIQTLQVAVFGTTLSVSGPPSIVQNANGAYSVSLTDSAGNGIANQTVSLTSALGNALTPASVTTGVTGTASFALAAANSGSETITATWQNVTATEAVAISNQNFSITAPAANANIPVSPASAPVPVPVTIAWTASGAGQNGTVVFSTTRGTLSATSVAATNGALATPVTLYSPTAGQAIISATALNGSNQTVATTQMTVQFVATTPATVSVQGTPSTVAVQGQSTITATVTDASGNPVYGAKVDFTLTDTTGGSLSSPSAQTTAQGQATVTYTASTTSSTPNGVSIAVKVEGTNVSSATTLTVGGQTVFLSLGTGNTITPITPLVPTQYELPYTVQAVDAAGNGVSNVAVTFSIQSVSYETGIWDCPLGTCTTWQQVIAAPAGIADPKLVPGIGGCKPTQVYELNGQIQTSVPNPVPSNYVLTSIPGNVAATDVGSAVTGTGGTAAVNIIYPRDHAMWVAVALTATATVEGTQNSTTATFFLPILAADIGNPKVDPPGIISPYGESLTCY
jgi:adhesin/invasin